VEDLRVHERVAGLDVDLGLPDSKVARVGNHKAGSRGRCQYGLAVVPKQVGVKANSVAIVRLCCKGPETQNSLLDVGGVAPSTLVEDVLGMDVHGSWGTSNILMGGGSQHYTLQLNGQGLRREG
jgi:hypothetical protein